MFIQKITEAGIEGEDVKSNVIRGKALVDEIENCYQNHEPIPQEVADWLLQDYLNTCSSDSVVLMSGGPYSELDLEFMMKHHPPAGIILLAPTSPEWMQVIPEREQLRGKIDFEGEYDAASEWKKWKSRVADVLKLAHKNRYPVMHVNMRSARLNKDELKEKLVGDLTGFVNKVKEGEVEGRLRILDVE